MTQHNTGSLFSAEKADIGRIIQVAFESGADNEFSYRLPDSLGDVACGQRVKVPFGRSDRPEVGFCVRIDSPPPVDRRGRPYRLKLVREVLDSRPLVDSHLLELARWMGRYYICGLGQALAAMVPSAVKRQAGTARTRYVYLASPRDGPPPRGPRQKSVVRFLEQHRAVAPETAVELSKVLAAAECTAAVVKSLAGKGLVGLVERTTLTALPVIPEDFSQPQTPLILNECQKKAFAHIAGRIKEDRFGVTLLFGVTDSGKTELYIRAIEKVLKAGRSAIVLLPEIALTAQTVQRFSVRFDGVAVMHSGLTAAQRNYQWQQVHSGRARLVIGARSAIFAPVRDLGLVVVDEEHEPSYKQDTVPRYHARDVAIKRAQISGAHCILGSATPSLETLWNCRMRKHFTVVSLPHRVGGSVMPTMKLVDMRRTFITERKNDLVSESLMAELKRAIARSEQAILLLNRRGYSNMVFCPSCRQSLRCRNCDVAVSFHKSARAEGGNGRFSAVAGQYLDYGYAACHHCMSRTLVPRACPFCGKRMAMIGVGSQKLEEELNRKLPSARIARVDSDTMSGRNYYSVLSDFGAGKIDILAGTQMLAKGLHFPNVTVVGIVSADTCLYLPDFRANERTFQLICQVAGRAGRAAKQGVVFVQTFLPDQPAIKFALKHDYEGFVAEELKHRKACNLPPFRRMAVIVARHGNFQTLQTACQAIRSRLDSIIAAGAMEVDIRGPMPAAITRMRGQHRMQIILRSPGPEAMQRLFAAFKNAGPIRPAVQFHVDNDPVNLL